MAEPLQTKHRIAVQLPAEISIYGGRKFSCVIEEVGLDDVITRLDSVSEGAVATGDFVTLDFKVPGAESGTASEAPAKVISHDGARFVLAFEISDQSAVRALNEWAFSRQTPPTSHPQFDPRLRHELFTTCRLAARRFLEDRLPAVLEQAREILFERAKDAPSHLQQAEAFDAMQEAEQLMPAIKRGFLDAFEAKMDELWSGKSGGERTKKEPTPDELELVDTSSFNDWLLIVQIITRAQRLVSQIERSFCSAFGQLLPKPVDATELPFGLEGSCAIFHDSIQNLGAVKITRHSLLTAFEGKVVKDLPGLYGELGTLLESAGVEPVKESYRIQPAAAGPRSPAGMPSPEPDAAESPGPAASEAEAPPIRPAAAMPAAEPHAVNRVHPVSLPAAEETRPQWDPHAGPIWEADAYGTARKLAHLSRAPRMRPADGRAAEVAVLSEKSVADVNDVLDALARVNDAEGAGGTGEFGVLELAERVRSQLGAAGLELDQDTADLVNMVSDFVDVMLLDPLVHSRVRERVRRLAFALFRTALMGDPFFAVGPHPARQLLDALGIIQPGIGDEVMQQVDAAIETILQDTSPVRDEYAGALAQIAPLAEHQRRLLADRIEEVAAHCERQQSTLQSLRSHGGEDADKEKAAETGHVPALFQKSLERADRIAVGEILLLDADHYSPRPATLGWKSSDGQTFAFVTHSEVQAVTFTRRALAMELHRERARRVEGSELAYTERALCRRLFMLHNQLHMAATRDALTGLVNRKHFIAEVKNALDRAGDSFDSDHLCLVQADGFEEIVERFGRKASKQLLKTLAEMLTRQIGNAGIACRIKAHRFGILIFTGDKDDASEYVQRFRRSVEEARCVLKGESFSMTVSSGVVTLSRETRDIDTAMSLAETALLAAAEAGGNRVEMAPDERPATENRETVSAVGVNINEFIEQGRLFLRAQRIHPLQLPAKHTYHEILLGVRAPDGEVLSPGPIVAAAERCGQVGELDRWVVREALRWMMGAPERLEHVAGYSLNLSGATLGDGKLINDILELFSSTRVPPGKIMFEITETAGIDSFTTARDFLISLQNQGCKFSLDDFGVGHASFAYLRNLPVDKVKIDGMFVKDLALNPNDRAVVQSITEIAHFMGRHTVAEFVENDEILGIVREIGVDYVQGNWIEKPLAVDELVMPPRPLDSLEVQH